MSPNKSTSAAVDQTPKSGCSSDSSVEPSSSSVIKSITSSNAAPKTIETTKTALDDCIGRLSQLLHDRSAASNPQNSQDRLFWKTQPVPLSVSDLAGNECIEADKPADQLSTVQVSLPEGLVWTELNLLSNTDTEELYTLLSENYVEDGDSFFRFNYPPHFLEWALCPPGWKKAWHLGIKDTKHTTEGVAKLVGFISAVPIRLKVDNVEKDMAEVNFLCLHKSLRSKRLSPLLIQEITRRVHLQGNMFQAIFTAGVQLTPAVSTGRYFHRPLNYRKLLDIGFCTVPVNQTVERMEDKLRLKKCVNVLDDFSNVGQLFEGLRLMQEKDVPAVFKLLNNYLQEFKLAPQFTSEEEVAHWLLPRKELLHSFVVEKKCSSSLEAFVSFYSLPSSALLSKTKDVRINTAYLFYVAFEDPHEADRLMIPLMKAILAIAKSLGFDVFNCLNISQNSIFFDSLKFGPGDGHLYYYLYNWKTTSMPAKDVALVML